MDEYFLHYIWKYQKLNSSNLLLVDGQRLKIFYPGNHNEDSGPDFEEARIKIGFIEWAGQVEIHIRSSDWIHHNHQKDSAYKNVILHVVWEYDREILVDQEKLPTLELKGYVDFKLFETYYKYSRSTNEIPCSVQLKQVSKLTINNMLDRVLVERLVKKSERIFDYLAKNKNDWEEVTYRVLAENFGFSTNKKSFERLTEVLPFSILKKVLQKQSLTEALIFGQAGFLKNIDDDYCHQLKLEYEFLKNKFQLNDPLVKTYWKFGKLRPANLPTVRLSQFSSLLHKNPQLFTFLIQTKSIKELKHKLLTEVSIYWQNHYDFKKPRKKLTKTIGKSSFENILINTIAPLLATYSKYTDEQKYMDRAIELLESLAPENNRITRKWELLNIKPENAFNSQALIQLYKNFCQKKRCLQCSIGVKILSK